MAAAPPGRFAGCRDLVDMLELLPDELDAAIMEHAGGLTQFLHGRLRQPMSLQTITLLWTEAIIADNVAAVRWLPQLDLKPCYFLARSQEMVDALKDLGRTCTPLASALSLFNGSLLDSPARLVEQCPEAGPMLLPFVRSVTPEWRDNGKQRSFLCVAAAAAGDHALLQLLLEPDEDDSTRRQRRRELIVHSIAQPCMVIACRLGDQHIARMFLRSESVRRVPLSSAVLSNNREMVEMLVGELGGDCIDESAITAALRLNHSSLAAWLIEMRQRHDYKPERMAAVCIEAGNLDVLRVVASPGVLRLPGVGGGCCLAAETGRLEILQYVHVVSGEAAWAEQALKHAIKGGWVDVARWLALGPAAHAASAIVMDAVDAGCAVMLGVLLDVWGGRSSALMDAAAERGCLAVVRLMHERGVDCSPAAMDGAARGGHLEVVRFLRERRQEACTRVGLARAISNGDEQVLRVLLGGPITGSIDGVCIAIMDGRVTADAVRALHHGVDCGACECSMLTDAIKKQDVRLVGVFIGLRHAVCDDAARALGGTGNLELLKKMAPLLLGARQWGVVEEAAKSAGLWHVAVWIMSNRPAG
ncbi:hypothetical protein HK105_206192 [Polyrhizophydium stewartii]|uniref:Ankyrin repeat protein n=1 Tax=Polyrhizophydium stewartii TaxID=2732419 RepID=A0ABR4N423_9FUNG